MMILSHVCRLDPWIPEELDQWNPAPDQRTVPQGKSGLSAVTMTGYSHRWPQFAASTVLAPERYSLFGVSQQGPKCPSGCRIQGLMNNYDIELLKKIERIKNLLDQNKAKFRTADHVSKQTYDYLKDKLTLESGQCVHILKPPLSCRNQLILQNLKKNIDCVLDLFIVSPTR